MQRYWPRVAEEAACFERVLMPEVDKAEAGREMIEKVDGSHRRRDHNKHILASQAAMAKTTVRRKQLKDILRVLDEGPFEV